MTRCVRVEGTSAFVVKHPSTISTPIDFGRLRARRDESKGNDVRPLIRAFQQKNVESQAEHSYIGVQLQGLS